MNVAFITKRVLQSDIVRNNLARFEPAVKLAAAYPASGVPFRTQQKFKVDDAIEELMRLAIGEIVINIGLPENRGVTLFGLHSGIQKTDWLSQTVRDFRRGYGEHHEATQRRATKMFARIVKEHLFKNWTVVDERPSTFTSNFSIILQGDFQSFANAYPRRKVHVRILWEDEEQKDALIDGDIVIEYYLTLRNELQDNPDERRKAANPLIIENDKHVGMMQINLLYVRDEGVPAQILSQLEGVWSPYDLSPLVLMNIYEMLEEKRSEKLIPQQDDQFIKNGFQPEMVYNIIRDLFNAQIGQPLGGVSQARITELLVETLLDYRYRDTYKTVIAQTNWRSSLNKYSNAIGQLSNMYQKRGEVEIEGSKDEIASLLTYSNTGLDSFIKTFGGFIEVTRDWRGGSSGAIRFTLHDLEQHIVHWLKNSSRIEKSNVGGKSFDVHVLNTSEVYEQARNLGYQDDEIEELLKLLIRRELLEVYQNYLIREIPSRSVDLDNVSIQIREFSQEVVHLLEGFSDSSQLIEMKNRAETWQGALEKERQSGSPDPQRVHQLSRNISLRQNELHTIAQDKKRDVSNQIGLLRRNLRPINPQHLNVLGNLIEGSVSYVDQVNVLRTHLRNHANNVKAKVDRANTQVETLEQMIKQSDLSYERLSHCAKDVVKLDAELQGVSAGVNEFETLYRHLSDWQRLVDDGSQLLNEMQQMGHLAATYQENFDQLSRDIRGAISSTSNKLDALPNHSLYASPLGNLRQQVNKIRMNVQDEFVNLQNRYYKLFTDKGLYTREKIGRPFEYNISNPDETYRLLYERVQKLTSDLYLQIEKVIRDRRQDIINIISTPLFRELADDARRKIEDEGTSLIRLADGYIEQMTSVKTSVQDISVIRDLDHDGNGQFFELNNILVDALKASRELSDGSRRLSQWLTDISLTQEEENLISHLRSDDSENLTDIFDWLSSTKMSPEEFWDVMRALHEKHRIRVLITRVRR